MIDQVSGSVLTAYLSLFLCPFEGATPICIRGGHNVDRRAFLKHKSILVASIDFIQIGVGLSAVLDSIIDDLRLCFTSSILSFF